MAEYERPHLDDGEAKRGFASAFVNRLGGKKESDRRLGPRIWAVGLAVVLVAGIAIAVGFLARPHPHVAAAQNTAKTNSLSNQTLTPTVTPNPAFAQGQPVVPNMGANAGVPVYNAPAGVGQVGGFPAVGVPAQAPVMNVPQIPVAPAVPQVQGPAAAPRPISAYSATTGYGCAESAGLVFTQHGFYSNGKSGWIRLDSGGLNAATCNKTYDAMPMSGSATADDTSNYATWQFQTGSVRSGTCRVSIWIPNDTNIQHVGGHPSTYLIYTSFAPGGTAPFAVQVDQTANRGKWATATVKISSGALSVKLLSRGIDYNNAGPDYAHHAVSAVHVDCTG
jgi:hypothetical protein